MEGRTGRRRGGERTEKLSGKRRVEKTEVENRREERGRQEAELYGESLLSPCKSNGRQYDKHDGEEDEGFPHDGLLSK